MWKLNNFNEFWQCMQQVVGSFLSPLSQYVEFLFFFAWSDKNRHGFWLRQKIYLFFFPNGWKINAIQSIFSPFPMIPSSIYRVEIRWMVRRFTSLQPYSRFFISKSSCFFSSQPHAGDVVPSSLSSFSISLSSLGVVLLCRCGKWEVIHREKSVQ